MHTKPRPIKSVSPMPVAAIVATYYAIVGLLLVPVYAYTDFKSMYAPLGFLMPLLSAKIDLTFKKPDGPLGILLLGVITSVFYAATGWLSGFLCAALYNFMSKHFQIRISGEVETQDGADPSA